MTDDLRCPQCSARVSADAEWCTLCYASLRVAAPPAPVEPDLSAWPRDLPGSEPAPQAAYDPLTSPLAALGVPATPMAPTSYGVDTATPAVPAAPAPAQPPAPSWPCRNCGESVSLDLDSCVRCGTRFLAGADDDLRLPVVGKVTDMDPAVRGWIMVGGALGITALLIGLSLLVGLVA